MKYFVCIKQRRTRYKVTIHDTFSWGKKSRVKIKVKRGDSTAVAARCTAKRKAAVNGTARRLQCIFMDDGVWGKVYDSLRSTILVRHAKCGGRSRPPLARLVVSILIRSLTRRSRGRVSQSGSAIDLQATIARVLWFHDCNRPLKTRHVDASNRDSANEPLAGDFLE